MKRESRYNHVTVSLHQSLLLFCAFSCLLCMVRVVMTGERSFLFMIWNLALAFVPYAISGYLTESGRVLSKMKSVMLIAGWLLFVPNSFYLLTDLFHLSKFGDVPQWFDLLLLLSFALSGMLLGIVSLRRVEVYVEKWRGSSFTIPFVIGVMFLNALGVYLGRYLRFNSWDVFMQPVSLFQELAHLILNPLDNALEWGMVCSYTAFMALTYLTIRKLAESFYSSAKKQSS